MDGVRAAGVTRDQSTGTSGCGEGGQGCAGARQLAARAESGEAVGGVSNPVEPVPLARQNENGKGQQKAEQRDHEKASP